MRTHDPVGWVGLLILIAICVWCVRYIVESAVALVRWIT